jgi:hypothetical protein
MSFRWVMDKRIKRDKRIKNEYAIAFSLRLNHLPVPKTAGLK